MVDVYIIGYQFFEGLRGSRGSVCGFVLTEDLLENRKRSKGSLTLPCVVISDHMPVWFRRQIIAQVKSGARGGGPIFVREIDELAKDELDRAIQI